MADAIDAKIKRGEDCGDLCGIPFVVKDNIDWLGLVTTAGSPKAYSKKATKNAPVLQGLIDRGAIPIGKANMNEWAVGLTGENAHFGNVPNPHLDGCLSGGSSSGSARAVAMGIVPMALGSDTGGSIRMPAAWCGIVGLRPSSESFSLDGVVPRSRSLDVVGPLVNSLEDCDYFLGSTFTPKSSPLTPENAPKSIKIGWDPRLLEGVEASVRSAFIQFMQNAQANPAVLFVEQSWPSFAAATDCSLTVLQMEFLNDFNVMCGEVELFSERLGKPVINELRHSAFLGPQALVTAQKQLLQFRQDMANMLSSVDMLALPLTPCGPVEAAKLPEAAKPLRELSLAMGASGLPIIGMPMLSTKDGFGLTAPSLAGVQLVGHLFQEHKLIYMVKTYLDAPS
jgi:aspartyl-tRNA(Asn)/glutamyl-tRNA(Gln) amidotransferase subunit A